MSGALELALGVRLQPRVRHVHLRAVRADRDVVEEGRPRDHDGSLRRAGLHVERAHRVEIGDVEDAAAGKEIATVGWYLYPNGTVQFFNIQFGSGVPCSGSVATQSKYTACNGSQSSSDSIAALADVLVAYGYFDMAGAGVTATNASGSASQTILEPQGPTVSATWTWSFQRKQ